ncbi:aldehyde dehydrogenase family protein [Leptolyngbya sp. 15MV]|nr:aldehyde dehydrogenase family protein [Leptolyngbya sp. 15MV]
MSIGASVAPADLVGGRWIELAGGDGPLVESRDPSRPSEVVWSGRGRIAHVDAAISAARRALPAWSGMGLERRAEVLRRYRSLCEASVDEMALLISRETGKALWDARQEAAGLAAKVDITLDSTPGSGPLSRVSGFETSLDQGIRGIKERQVQRPWKSGQGAGAQRVADDDLAAIRAAQQVDVGAEHRGGGTVALDHDAAGGAARDGLEADRSCAREGIDDDGALAVPTQEGEQRLPDAVGHGPGDAVVRGRIDLAGTELPRDDAHGKD